LGGLELIFYNHKEIEKKIYSEYKLNKDRTVSIISHSAYYISKGILWALWLKDFLSFDSYLFGFIEKYFSKDSCLYHIDIYTL